MKPPRKNVILIFFILFEFELFTIVEQEKIKIKLAGKMLGILQKINNVNNIPEISN